jgi:hypothetical protein
MADEDHVRGMAEAKAQAELGMKLFKQEMAMELDTAGAEAYKKIIDEQIAALEAEAAALTGKDNKKARTEKSKEASNLKLEPKYIDACKVAKGLEPKNGNFAAKPQVASDEHPSARQAAQPEAETSADTKESKKKDDKPKKKQESAGISPDERKELEQLKTDIIAKKSELKEQGMSGGQINKNEDVVRMVNRMNELKEKENPGCLSQQKEEKKPKKGKALSSDQEVAKAALEKEIEEYRGKLRTEFGYSAKEIKADPDMKEMEAKLAAYK